MSTPSAQSDVTILDSEASLLPLLESIDKLAIDPPSLYFGLEGITVGRQGSISVLSLYVSPTKNTYLIDIHTLGRAAFSTNTNSGISLKTVLESAVIPKVVFDIRNDSDALFSHFQVSVDGIKDLQLMELATRIGSKDFVCSLMKCIQKDSPATAAAKKEWSLAKGRGHRLFSPEKGGRYEVFNDRPLRPEIIRYCEQDIALLPALYEVYNTKLLGSAQAFWRVHIRTSTRDRIKQSQSSGYDGKAQKRALGWDDESLDRAQESWNEHIMMEYRSGDLVLDENDNWVPAPQSPDLEYWLNERA